MSANTILQQIRIKSKENHAKTGLISYVLCFFVGILSAGLILLNLLVPGLFIVVGLLLVIPLIFALQVSINILKSEAVMTFKGFISLFGIYFTEHFRSTFRVLRSGLLALGVFVIFFLTSSLVCSTSFFNADFLGMKSLIDDIQSANLADYDVIMSIYNDHLYLINVFLICTIFVSSFCMVCTFIYFASKASFTLTYRINEPKYTGKMLMMVTDNLLRNYRKEFLIAHWGSNFPMVIIFLGSFASGAYVGTLYNFDYNSLFTFGLAFALLISLTLFGSKYYANKEAIADYFRPTYLIELEKFNKNLSKSIQEMLKSFENDTKKDSEES